VAVVVAALVAVCGWAPPVAADPARPTDYRSTVDRLSPPTGDVTVQVRGGDAFLEVTSAPGHEVIVLGYQDEPYLRFGTDGTVQRNRRSPATTINQTRFGTEAPADADPEAEPDWETVATGGRYAWHDHRIHWMSPDPPPTAAGDAIFDWTVPMEVDGADVMVRGTLTREEGVSPLPWIGLATLIVAGVLVAAWRGRRRSAILIAAVGALIGAITASVLGIAEWSTSPPGAGASPLLVVLPPVAAGLAAGALGLLAFRRRDLAEVLAFGAVALLAGWVLRELPALWKPVLPTELPANVDRAGLTLVMALVIASAVLFVGSRRLRGGRNVKPAVRPQTSP